MLFGWYGRVHDSWIDEALAAFPETFWGTASCEKLCTLYNKTVYLPPHFGWLPDQFPLALQTLIDSPTSLYPLSIQIYMAVLLYVVEGKFTFKFP